MLTDNVEDPGVRFYTCMGDPDVICPFLTLNTVCLAVLRSLTCLVRPDLQYSESRHMADTGAQWWANLDQAPEDLDKTIFRDLSPTPKP